MLYNVKLYPKTAGPLANLEENRLLAHCKLSELVSLLP